MIKFVQQFQTLSLFIPSGKGVLRHANAIVMVVAAVQGAGALLARHIGTSQYIRLIPYFHLPRRVATILSLALLPSVITRPCQGERRLTGGVTTSKQANTQQFIIINFFNISHVLLIIYYIFVNQNLENQQDQDLIACADKVRVRRQAYPRNQTRPLPSRSKLNTGNPCQHENRDKASQTFK